MKRAAAAVLASTFAHRIRRKTFTNIPRGPERGWIDCRPALFDPDQLGRVIDVGFNSTLERELVALTATRQRERPLARLPVGPAVVADGQVFARDNRYHLSDRKLSLADLVDAEEIDAPVTLVSTAQGLRFFGHWLRDDCSAFEALRNEDARVLSLPRPDWPDAPAYEAAFDQDWEERAAFRTRDLTLVRDVGFSHEKRERLQVLRARLREAVSERASHEVVYLARGPGGAPREVANDEALVQALEAEGVRILRAESGNPIPALLDAKLLITVEGSQAAHGVHTLAAGGALLILQPPQRFYNPHVHWTQLLGMHYGIVVGEVRGPNSFHIRPDEVLDMASRLFSSIR